VNFSTKGRGTASPRHCTRRQDRMGEAGRPRLL